MGDVYNGISRRGNGGLGYNAQFNRFFTGPDSCLHLLIRMRLVRGRVNWPLDRSQNHSSNISEDGLPTLQLPSW
jgi:hypothetical protein